jgi:hypothetical protein
VICTDQLELLAQRNQGAHYGLGMWLGWGDKECIKTLDGEASWKASTCKTKKEL